MMRKFAAVGIALPIMASVGLPALATSPSEWWRQAPALRICRNAECLAEDDYGRLRRNRRRRFSPDRRGKTPARRVEVPLDWARPSNTAYQTRLPALNRFGLARPPTIRPS